MFPKYAEGMANSVDLDQTAPLGKVLSGSTLFDQTCPSQNLGSLWYRNDPKFSDRYDWANSADPDQTAPRAVWSGSTLFAIPSASFGLTTLW